MNGANMQADDSSHVVERRCATVRENGEPCRGIPARGETICHAHRRYQEAAAHMVVTVPVMDDQASITFIRSQTVRALAQGSIPPANGRVMLEACRDAERRLDRALEVRKVALRYAAVADKIGLGNLERYIGKFLENQGSEHKKQSSEHRAQSSESSDQRTGIREPLPAPVSEISEAELDDRVYPLSEVSWAEQMRRRKARYEAQEKKRQEEARDQSAEHNSQSAEHRAQSSESGDQRSVNSERPAEQGGAPEPAMHPSIFPGVKEQWDRALVRTEAKITEMVAPAEGQSWHDFLAQKKAREAAIAAAV